MTRLRYAQFGLWLFHFWYFEGDWTVTILGLRFRRPRKKVKWFPRHESAIAQRFEDGAYITDEYVSDCRAALQSIDLQNVYEDDIVEALKRARSGARVVLFVDRRMTLAEAFHCACRSARWADWGRSPSHTTLYHHTSGGFVRIVTGDLVDRMAGLHVDAVFLAGDMTDRERAKATALVRGPTFRATNG